MGGQSTHIQRLKTPEGLLMWLSSLSGYGTILSQSPTLARCLEGWMVPLLQ